MGAFEWLATPTGVELTHAVIVLILAVSGWLAADTRRRMHAVEQKLDGHLRREIPHKD